MVRQILSGVVYVGELKPEGSEVLTFFIERKEILNGSQNIRQYRCFLPNSAVLTSQGRV